MRRRSTGIAAEGGPTIISDALTNLLTMPLWVFMAVLARVGPVLVLSPPTRSAGVPVRVRAGLAIAMAVMLTPIAIPDAAPMPDNVLNILIALATEMLLGVLIGSVVMLAISALQLAGQAIGQLSGFDVADAIDPTTDETMSILASLMGWMAIALVLVLGGHRQVIDCCLESYAAYPAGTVQPQAEWLAELDELMRHTLRIGIRLAAPVGTALLLANLLTGLIARTLPQLSVLAVGFNINAFVLLGLMIMSLGGMAWVFQVELAGWLDACHRLAAPTALRTLQ